MAHPPGPPPAPLSWYQHAGDDHQQVLLTIHHLIGPKCDASRDLFSSLTVSPMLSSSSRRSLSSSSEAVSFQQDVGSISDSPGRSSAMSPFNCTTEEDHIDVDRSRRAPETMRLVQVSVSEPVDASEQKESRRNHPDSASLPSSTADASISGSPSSPGTSAPALRFIRQPSAGGAGSPKHSYQPFPHRKTPRISEAARRLGMYSSCRGHMSPSACRNQKGLLCANINTE